MLNLNCEGSKETGGAIETPTRHLTHPGCASVGVSGRDVLSVIKRREPTHEGHWQRSFNRSCHLWLNEGLKNKVLRIVTQLIQIQDQD